MHHDSNEQEAPETPNRLLPGLILSLLGLLLPTLHFINPEGVDSYYSRYGGSVEIDERQALFLVVASLCLSFCGLTYIASTRLASEFAQRLIVKVGENFLFAGISVFLASMIFG